MNYVLNTSLKNIILILLVIGFTPMCIKAQIGSLKPDSASKKRNVADNFLTGSVRDAGTGKTLPGISIASGTELATITDEKGEFRIEVSDHYAVINVSGQGYQQKEIVLKGRKTIVIDLYPDTYKSFYSEVKLPYSVNSKLHTAYAVETVSSYDNWQRTAESSDTYLQGRVAGLNVTRRSGTPGVGGNLLLNGFSSLYSTNQPLIVVDGMIYDNFSYGTSTIAGHISNPLSNIDIKDVDSYTIIKDGTAFYGTRGANGVILITTNRAKSQVTNIDFAAYGGYNYKPGNLPVMNDRNYRIFLSDLLVTVPGETPANIQLKPYINDSANPLYYQYHNTTNWQDQVMKNSYNQNYYMKITGGDNIATYGLSVGYLGEKGITRNTDHQRNQTRFNADLNLTKKLSAQANLSFVNNQQNLKSQGIAPKTNVLYLGLVKAPILAPLQKSSTNETAPIAADVDAFNISNPYALTEDMVGINKNYRFVGSVSFFMKLNEKLKLQTLIGVNYDKVRENFFIPGLGVVPDTLATGISTNSSGTSTKSLYSVYNDSRISYASRFRNDQKLAVNFGARYSYSEREADAGLGYSSATDDYVSVGAGLPALRSNTGYNSKWNWMDVYGNVDYELKNKYFASLNIAADASSRFGKNASTSFALNGNKLALMPSIGLGWLVSSEGFMKSVRFIDILKFRAGYGMTGNDDIGDYTTAQFYSSQNLLGSQGLVRGNIANPSLKWETVKKANLGMDISLFKERLNLSVDYFNHHTTDMITYEPTGTISGFSYAITNNGAMETKGLTFAASGRLLNTRVKFDIGGNISFYKNKLTMIPDDKLLTTFAGGTIISQVGQTANLFYGFKTNGVFASEAEAAASGLKNLRADGTITNFRGGDMRYIDNNHDGIIDDNDRQVIGDPNPAFTGSFITSGSYKRWSMDAVVTFTSGNDIYNYTRRQLSSMSGYENQLDYAINRWKIPGQVTNVPRAEYGDPAGNSRFSDRWIESGAYLRLRTISVTYAILKTGSTIKSAKLFLTADNLFTITNYLGYDPEFSASGNLFSQGTDIGLEPQFRTMQIGIRLGL